MPVTIIALKILLLLLPGFFTLWIQESLGEKKERTQSDKILIIFLYDIFIFGIYLGILNLLPNLRPFMLSVKGENIDIIGVSFWNVIIFLLISSVLGIIFAIFNFYGWHYKILRKWKITNATGRISVWNDILFENSDYYVIVHLADDIRVFGWLSDFSIDPEQKYLFVKDAKYLGDIQNEDVEIKGEGILLTNESKIKYIEFLTLEKENLNGKKN